MKKHGDFSSILFDIDFRLQVSQIKFANKFNKVYSILNLAL